MKKIADIIVDADVSHAKYRKHWLEYYEDWTEADEEAYLGYKPDYIDHSGFVPDPPYNDNPFTDYKIGDTVEVFFIDRNEYLSGKIIDMVTDTSPIQYKVEGPGGIIQWSSRIFEGDIGFNEPD